MGGIEETGEISWSYIEQTLIIIQLLGRIAGQKKGVKFINKKY